MVSGAEWAGLHRRGWTPACAVNHHGAMRTVSTYLQRAREDGLPLLIVAAVVVGVAIGIDGSSRRAVNGVGGVLLPFPCIKFIDVLLTATGAVS